MRVLVVHNSARGGAPSGEEVAVATEVDGMRAAGWQVELLRTSSDDLVGPDRSLVQRLRASPRGVWNRDAGRRLREAVDRLRPDVIHLHNDFPQLGPAIHHVLAGLATPHAQSIHNYRFACVNGSFFRDGRPCTDCIGRSLPAPGLRHRCGDTTARSAYVAGWIAANRATRSRADALLVANSRYVAARLVEDGASPDRVTHRYNLAWPAPATVVPREHRRGVIAAGRLDAIKGLDLLVEAWLAVDPPGERLTIVGAGPQEAHLRRLAGDRDDVEILASVPHGEVLDRFAHARLAVVPSRWPEPFGRVALEAQHHGTPALVSDAGGLPEVATRLVSGMVVPVDDADALADRLAWALQDGSLPDPVELSRETEARFGLAAYIERTEQLYAGITGSPDRGVTDTADRAVEP